MHNMTKDEFLAEISHGVAQIRYLTYVLSEADDALAARLEAHLAKLIRVLSERRRTKSLLGQRQQAKQLELAG